VSTSVCICLNVGAGGVCARGVHERWVGSVSCVHRSDVSNVLTSLLGTKARAMPSSVRHVVCVGGLLLNVAARRWFKLADKDDNFYDCVSLLCLTQFYPEECCDPSSWRTDAARRRRCTG
jgi:hypothetical protein